MTADRPATEPRTEAGRALLMGDPIAGGSYRIPHLDTCIWWKVGGRCDGDCGVLPAILAIEAEASQGAAPPDLYDAARAILPEVIDAELPSAITSDDPMAGIERMMAMGDRWERLRAALSEGAAPRAEGLDVAAQRVVDAYRQAIPFSFISEETELRDAVDALEAASRPSDERVPESEER